MRILMLCDRVPNGLHDGLLLRVVNLAREIARRHAVDLLCLRPPAQPFDLVPGLFGRAWSAAPGTRAPSPGWYGPLVGWNPAAAYTTSPEVERLLQGEIDPADYDVVWDAGAVLFAQLPPRWNAVPVVADMVDDLVLTFGRALRQERRPIAKLRLWKYRHVYGRFEGETMRRVAHCVMVGDDDAASFARASPTVPVSVIANGVDTAYYTPDPAAAVPGRLVFEGTMSFPPNAHAAMFMARDIMPLVWAQRADATLALVGRDPPAALRALAGERVFVTGSVDDVRVHVRQAEVFVCPLVLGAGIKNKLLQAWAMALPVVATPLSIGGLDARDGIDMLVRAEPAAFAAAVLELLADPPRRAALGQAGQAVARSRFDWVAMAQRFEAVLASAAAQRSAPTDVATPGSRR